MMTTKYLALRHLSLDLNEWVLDKYDHFESILLILRIIYEKQIYDIGSRYP